MGETNAISITYCRNNKNKIKRIAPCFDNLRKGHSTDGRRKYGSSMCEACTKTDGNAAGNIGSGEIWGFAQSRRPHDHRPDNSNDQLSSGDEPMSVDHVGRLFVVDVVEGISFRMETNENRDMSKSKIMVSPSKDSDHPSLSLSYLHTSIQREVPVHRRIEEYSHSGTTKSRYELD